MILRKKRENIGDSPSHMPQLSTGLRISIPGSLSQLCEGETAALVLGEMDGLGLTAVSGRARGGSCRQISKVRTSDPVG